MKGVCVNKTYYYTRDRTINHEGDKRSIPPHYIPFFYSPCIFGISINLI